MLLALLYITIIFVIIYLINIKKFINGIKKPYLISLNKNLIQISIIVAVKNGEKNIIRLLDALVDQTYSGDMEFLIVDDDKDICVTLSKIFAWFCLLLVDMLLIIDVIIFRS